MGKRQFDNMLEMAPRRAKQSEFRTRRVVVLVYGEPLTF